MSFVRSLFVGRVCLRCDNEPSSVGLMEAVKSKLPDQVVVETTPHCSPGSLGAGAMRYSVLADCG